MENVRLNVALLRRKVPNLTSAAKLVGLRPATVSNLCTGKIPVGRAEVKTIIALAELAECSLDELILRGEKVEMIETKIKAIDLFAPLTKGGVNGLIARPGMGQLVLLAELFYRLKREGMVTILLTPEGNHPEVEDILNNMDYVVNTTAEVYDKVMEIGSNKEIAFASDRGHVANGNIQELQEKLESVGVSAVTTFLLDLSGEVVDENLPYGPLETVWEFDADLAARHKFPAVNPIYSTSSVLEGAHLDQQHLTIQQKAQKLLRRYRELRSLVQVRGSEKLPESEHTTFNRGERLEAYLTQPFYVAETFSGITGVDVQLQTTLEDVRKILDGVYDSVEVDKFNYIGAVK
ncbi:ATP synthase beta subunit C-terminal domain-containing protein [Sutcliffiella rhizosphaerae]|uniref:ATP synthase subunit beta n=1 Tax=Sutcliffiella rhizosphaerae TaxID=2880967 RepID=A0ABM8YRP4_9BACI|nr:hypothetical protein [Sutcliffiella rhizosphaerae]CAG9622669.1 ATP synthase subunit beta [Sutcliffiella rhizosphaerae]